MKPVYNNSGLPRLLFLGAGLMTLFTLLLLWWQMPDLFLRTLIWLRTQPRFRLEVDGLNNLPDNGPVVLVTNAPGIEPCLHVLSATDRATRFLFVEEDAQERLPWWLRSAAARSVASLSPGTNGVAEQVLGRAIESVLTRKGVMGLSLGGVDGESMVERLLGELAVRRPVPVLPVWYEPAPVPDAKRRQRIYILGGRLLPAGSTLADVHREFQRVAGDFRGRMSRGEALEHVSFVGH